MYNFLLNLHSGFRFIVTILVIVAILQSLIGWFGNRLYTETNRKVNLFAFISAHIQFAYRFDPVLCKPEGRIQ